MSPNGLPPPWPRRRERLHEALSREGLDALLVTHRPNVRYLTGFSGTSAWLWLTAEAATLLTDGRYADQAAEEAGGDVRVVTAPRLSDALELQLTGRRPRAGLEAARVAVRLLRRLEEFPVAWVETVELVETLRRHKDRGEVTAIRAALSVAEEALVEVAGALTAGTTERQVAAELEYACRRGGADGVAFDTIVASGGRTALPHGVASGRRLAEGEPVMIDMGCVVDGYCSDITRMVWVGGDEPGAEGGVYGGYRRVHELVDRARQAALEAAVPGAAAADVDAAARTLIGAGGHGEGFVHGAGHGVGLEIHEAPKLSPRSDDFLEEGMVLTVEPAVYLPGRFGVRIEDMVVVGPDRPRRLTTLGTDPILP